MQVRGAELHVTDEGTGRAFIWGHGLTASIEQEDATGLLGWRNLSAFARLVRYDARGHGASAATTDPDDYRWDNLARDMLALADGLGVGTFVAGGASMGCATSLFAAVAAPERIEKLLLVIPPTAWETRAAQSSSYEGAAAVVERQGVGALVDVLSREPLPPMFAKIPGVMEARMRFLAKMDQSALPSIFRGAAQSDFPTRDQVRALTMPALILCWEGDSGHPVSTAEALGELLPSSTLHVADDLTAVASWPRLVTDFIAEG